MLLPIESASVYFFVNHRHWSLRRRHPETRRSSAEWGISVAHTAGPCVEL